MAHQDLVYQGLYYWAIAQFELNSKKQMAYLTKASELGSSEFHWIKLENQDEKK